MDYIAGSARPPRYPFHYPLCTSLYFSQENNYPPSAFANLIEVKQPSARHRLHVYCRISAILSRPVQRIWSLVIEIGARANTLPQTPVRWLCIPLPPSMA